VNKFVQPAKGIKVTKNQVQDHLASAIELARTAKRMTIRDENFCDVLDMLDREVQSVIQIMQRVRGVR